jgi:hypothetical protein
MISSCALRSRRGALTWYLAVAGGTAITAAVAALAGGMPVAAAVASVPASGGGWSWPRELSQPRDSAGAGYFTALSCASRSDCTAAGIYGDRSGGDRVFAITERRGVWGKALGIAVPAASKTIYVAAPVLSCASAGNCAAGGTYFVHRQQVAFVVSEAYGTWGKARQVHSEPDAMSCPAAGDCTAALAEDMGDLTVLIRPRFAGPPSPYCKPCRRSIRARRDPDNASVTERDRPPQFRSAHPARSVPVRCAR